MKKIIIIFFLVAAFNGIYSQSYLGTVTKQVNFREGSNSDTNIIGSLKPKTQIFIVSLEAKNNYYNVIDITTDREGYVHKSYVLVGELVSKSSESVFSTTGKSTTYNCDVKIFNNTSKTMSLKMNEDMFYFKPYETKNMEMNPNSYDFRASAPGVIPYIGKEKLNSNQGYSWEFYIVTSTR